MLGLQLPAGGEVRGPRRFRARRGFRGTAFTRLALLNLETVGYDVHHMSKNSIFLMQRSKITVVYRSPYRTRRLRPIFRRGTDEVSGRGRRPSSLRSDASLDMARVSGSLV